MMQKMVGGLAPQTAKPSAMDQTDGFASVPQKRAPFRCAAAFGIELASSRSPVPVALSPTRKAYPSGDYMRISQIVTVFSDL
jgi:hypothetical protein